MRFGIGSSSLFAAVTTAASCGAVNAAMESLSGLGGAIPMAQMMTGEVIWGGVGSGLYSMLLFVILGVFISGLMVGRTPEFLGKKIEAREIKLTIIGTIAVPMMVLVATALAIGSKWGAPSIYNGGPQGFSETLYAYTSQGNNNGSAFAGYTGYLQPNGTNDGAFGISFADVLGGLAMLGGRFLPMLAVLAIAGSLAGKRVSPAGPRHAAHRHADVRRRPDRDRADRRAPHLRPRPAPRTRGPGPLRPALLTHARTQDSSDRRHRLHGGARPRLPPPHDRRQPGRLPRQGRRVDDRARRQGRRLEAHRPGLLQGPVATSRAARRRRTTRRRPPSSTTRARTSRTSPTSSRATSTPTSKRETPYTPGLTAADIPSDAVTTSASGVDPAHLRGQRAHPGQPRRPGARPRPGARARADRRQREPAAVRAGRREVDQRARAQPRARPGGDPMTDRPERSLFEPAILKPALAASCASSTRATWSATRSCSWSRSARCSPRSCGSWARPASPAGSPSPSRSGCG